ncbi:hypothetical protein [uncultured Oscillibacter sp.]|uniref:hypothetical protein n=1 Tax=uncultured Oscillibacter sp. TaxID=876091 RepID=UPI0025DEB7AD|nr:hypothetical protein [uncultured Oscillibacter sp.]
MKKFLSLMFAVALVCSLSAPTFASENHIASFSTSKVINEYEALKQLATTSPSALMANGYTNEEISSIQNYQELYRDHIRFLQSLDSTALSKHGYTPSQINLIKNFTGTDAEMRAIGSKVTISASTSNFSWTAGSRTTGRLRYTWEWDGVPAFKNNDVLAVSWNDWNVTYNTSQVKYYNVNTGDYYTSAAATLIYPTGNLKTLGAGHRFPVAMSDNYYYTREGMGTFTISSDVFAKKDFISFLEYGHIRLKAEVGFSVSVGGADASISFTVASIPAGDTSCEYFWPS